MLISWQGDDERGGELGRYPSSLGVDLRLDVVTPMGGITAGTMLGAVASTWILPLVISERTQRMYDRLPTTAAFIQVYDTYE